MISDRARQRIGTATMTVTLGLVAIAVALLLAALADPKGIALGTNAVGSLVLATTYPIVGWIIVSRRPENPIGWIFLIVGVSQAVETLAGAYARYGLITQPGSLPHAAVAAWVSIWVWGPGLWALFLLVLVFPDGRLPTRRWRPILWVWAIALVLATLPFAIASWRYRGPMLLADAPPSLDDPVLGAAVILSTIATIMTVVVAAAGVAAVVVRFRRSHGAERLQLKWFGWAALVVLALLMVTNAIVLPSPLDALSPIVILPLIPIATTVTILRYHLYDIDRLVSRTIGYGLLTGLLVAVYAVLILVLSGPLGTLTGGGPFAVAVSTLVVAALFQPVRARVQRIVDRRFDRARYDGERTAAAFSERLRDEVDLPTVTSDLDGTVRGVLAPETITVWLRGAIR